MKNEFQVRSQADACTDAWASIKFLRNTSFESIFEVSLVENLIGSVYIFLGLAYFTIRERFKSFIEVQGSPFIKLCLGSTELDRVISEPCYKEITS